MTTGAIAVNLRELAAALDEVSYEMRAACGGHSTPARVSAAVSALSTVAEATERYSLPRTRRLRISGKVAFMSDTDLSRAHIARAARLAERARRFLQHDITDSGRMRRLLILFEGLAATIQSADAQRLRTVKLRQGIASDTLRS